MTRRRHPKAPVLVRDLTQHFCADDGQWKDSSVVIVCDQLDLPVHIETLCQVLMARFDRRIDYPSYPSVVPPLPIRTEENSTERWLVVMNLEGTNSDVLETTLLKPLLDYPRMKHTTVVAFTSHPQFVPVKGWFELYLQHSDVSMTTRDWFEFSRRKSMGSIEVPTVSDISERTDIFYGHSSWTWSAYTLTVDMTKYQDLPASWNCTSCVKSFPPDNRKHTMCNECKEVDKHHSGSDRSDAIYTMSRYKMLTDNCGYYTFPSISSEPCCFCHRVLPLVCFSLYCVERYFERIQESCPEDVQQYKCCYPCSVMLQCKWFHAFPFHSGLFNGNPFREHPGQPYIVAVDDPTPFNPNPSLIRFYRVICTGWYEEGVDFHQVITPLEHKTSDYQLTIRLRRSPYPLRRTGFRPASRPVKWDKSVKMWWKPDFEVEHMEDVGVEDVLEGSVEWRSGEVIVNDCQG